MQRCIAIEEAFVTHAIADGWRHVLSSGQVEPGFAKMGSSIFADTPGNMLLHSRLLDIGPGRIRHMDEVGVDLQLLSLTAPGVQVFEPDLATRLATDANDILADAVRANPERLAGLAAIAPQDPPAAAKEVGRTRKLGLCGLIINSHTFGEYLDLPHYWPILEAAEAEGLPIYLHPREPGPGLVKPFLDYGLYFAGWGFAVEAGLHAMRLIMSGTFARFPDLKIILGHMGEGIPFWLQRIDSRYLLQVKIGAVDKLPLLPSEYFLKNFAITTSGVTSEPALRLCMEVLGPERILFAADYPYEDDAAAVQFLRNVSLNESDRDLIAFGNSEVMFGLRRTSS